MPKRHYQIVKIDGLNKNNINNVNQNIIILQQEIIYKSRHLLNEKVNINNIDNFSQILHYNILSKILELIINKLKMFGVILIKIDKSWLNKNLDLVILCNII